MREYTLANYEEELNHQVIFMDQAVCYCPEYLAGREMHDYPSRKLQLARAVYKGELPANDYIGDIVFSGMLSRQGERWQNFRENPEDCTDVMILCREMLLSKGYKPKAPDQLRALLETNDGHICKEEAWDLPEDPSSDTAILLDDLAAEGFKDGRKKLAEYCSSQGISFVNKADPMFLGFEYFACGLVEEGRKQLAKVIGQLQETGAAKVLVLSAQAYYILTVFAGKLGIEVPFEMCYLPYMAGELNAGKPAYVYGGSFNLRYLCNADKLNAQMKNHQEEPVKHAAEFIPLVDGDVRKNKLTIWQRPVGPEYACFGTDDKILKAICQNAVTDIRKAGADLIVSYEPSAIPVLKQELPDYEVIGYLELL